MYKLRFCFGVFPQFLCSPTAKAFILGIPYYVSMKKLLMLVGVFAALSVFIYLSGCTQPMEETCAGMPFDRALEIAQASGCVLEGSLNTDEVMCNETTKTWWIGLDAEREGCNPACVVNVENEAAEINWRCTGVIIPDAAG